MGKDFKRGDIGVRHETASKNALKMSSKTALFCVDFSAKIDTKDGPRFARENAPEGGRNLHVFEQRKGAEIDADSDAESRIETRTKPRAISTQKSVAHDAENASPNTNKPSFADLIGESMARSVDHAGSTERSANAVPWTIPLKAGCDDQRESDRTPR